jgi:hypothetical protein
MAKFSETVTVQDVDKPGGFCSEPQEEPARPTSRLLESFTATDVDVPRGDCIDESEHVGFRWDKHERMDTGLRLDSAPEGEPGGPPQPVVFTWGVSFWNNGSVWN